jgi:hypothetical protein
VWEAGDLHTNLVEAVHSDVNWNGVHSTLLSGLCQDYDRMQHATLMVSYLNTNREAQSEPRYTVIPSAKAGQVNPVGFYLRSLGIPWQVIPAWASFSSYSTLWSLSLATHYLSVLLSLLSW